MISIDAINNVMHITVQHKRHWTLLVIVKGPVFSLSVSRHLVYLVICTNKQVAIFTGLRTPIIW